MAEVSSTVNEPGIYAGALSASEVSSLYGQIATYPYNIAKAKQQMAMSSVPKGFSTTLNVPEDDPTDSLTAQILKSEWAQIGVKLGIRLMPGGPRFQIILNHGPDLGVQIIGNVPDALDPVEMPWEYFSSQQAAVNGNNSSNLRVPAINNLINQAQAATSPGGLGQVLDRGRDSGVQVRADYPAVMGRWRGCSAEGLVLAWPAGLYAAPRIGLRTSRAEA